MNSVLMFKTGCKYREMGREGERKRLKRTVLKTTTHFNLKQKQRVVSLKYESND